MAFGDVASEITECYFFDQSSDRLAPIQEVVLQISPLEGSDIKVCDCFCLNLSKDTLHLPILPSLSVYTQWVPEKCKGKSKLL